MSMNTTRRRFIGGLGAALLSLNLSLMPVREERIVFRMDEIALDLHDGMEKYMRQAALDLALQVDAELMRLSELNP